MFVCIFMFLCFLGEFVPLVLTLLKIYRSGAVKNLGYAMLVATLAMSNMAISSSVYTPPEHSFSAFI